MNDQGIQALTIKDLIVTGRVQGVGFRPFIYRHALRHQLNGWVRNDSGTVIIHMEGREKNVRAFTASLVKSAPPLAIAEIQSLALGTIEHCTAFEILKSCASQKSQIHIPPDLFTCKDCLTEMGDKTERRFEYPFINCTQCGPRYTIIEAMPYDRPNTSLKDRKSVV